MKTKCTSASGMLAIRDSKHAFASVPISKRNSMNIKHETKKSIGFRSENNDANNKNNNNEAN